MDILYTKLFILHFILKKVEILSHFIAHIRFVKLIIDYLRFPIFAMLFLFHCTAFKKNTLVSLRVAEVTSGTSLEKYHFPFVRVLTIHPESLKKIFQKGKLLCQVKLTYTVVLPFERFYLS